MSQEDEDDYEKACTQFADDHGFDIKPEIEKYHCRPLDKGELARHIRELSARHKERWDAIKSPEDLDKYIFDASSKATEGEK
jgi:hypothetical protein